MTVSDLRVLVNNLDEYIHIPGGVERLKKTVLHLALSGQLVAQDSSEGTGEDLYRQIQAHHNPQKELHDIEEIPFDIPDGWKWIRLEDLQPEFQNGASSRGDKGGIPVIVLRLADIKDKRISLANTRKVPISEKDIPKYRLVEGDILITRVNGSSDIVGQFNLCDQPLDAIYCDHFIRMRIRRDWLTPEFCALLGDSSLIRTRIKDMFVTTAGQKTINQKHINSLVIPLVPVAEQQRIVAKVSEIFMLLNELSSKYEVEEAERSRFVKASLRALSHSKSKLAFDNLNQIIRTKADTTELRKAILHLAVSGQLVPQIPSEGTGQDLYNQIQSEKAKLPKKQKAPIELEKDDRPFFIPTTWKWVRLGSLGITVTGKTPPTNVHSLTEGEIPFVGPGNITKNNKLTHDYQKKLTLEASRSSEVAEPGDILMVCIGGSIGKAALVSSALCFNQQINKITPIVIFPPFLFTSLISDYFQKLVIYSAVGGATPIINQNRWANLPIPLPPLAEQKRIVQKTTELLNLVSSLENKLEPQQ